jgi:hypothetical protein
MLTEFEVRQAVEVIVSSTDSPRLKVRRLLQLIRPIKLRFRELTHSRNVAVRTQNSFAAAHLDRLIKQLNRLHTEVRAVAYMVLETEEPKRLAYA